MATKAKTSKNSAKPKATPMPKAKPKPKNATAAQPTGVLAPPVAPGSPKKFRARVRMYRQGLGDCFLITMPRKQGAPFQMLIDCGALARDAKFMSRIVGHIRDTVRHDAGPGPGKAKARLDVVVATHEHQDHLSGFNQARLVFNNDFDFGAVWLPWTENLTKPAIKKIKDAKRKAVSRLRAALASPNAAAALDGAASLLGFSDDDDTTGAGRIAEALEYLKARGTDAGDLRYLEPGTGPIELPGVAGVRAYALGPPRDPLLLKGSEVTEQMKRDDVVYHLSATGEAGIDALAAALPAAGVAAPPETNVERHFPFAPEHRITRKVPANPLRPGGVKDNPYFACIKMFVDQTYDNPAEEWRRVDDDWLSAFGQLALDLDSDTNNTSLVLAFEFVNTKEVLLFVGDAQIGNWRSWATVAFKVPGLEKPMPAHDLLSRTVFYKVGHHCSHNATLKEGGLKLMESKDLVAFVPLDKETAASKGKKDPLTGKPKGWDMPASALFKALAAAASKRVVISDVTEPLTSEAKQAGVIATETYVDYFLK